jgi:hypothetical protein
MRTAQDASIDSAFVLREGVRQHRHDVELRLVGGRDARTCEWKGGQFHDREYAL